MIWTGGTSLYGFSNIYLYFLSTDYWAESTELNPFAHTWSLGVEEQFYLLFPIIIFIYFTLIKSKDRSKYIALALFYSISSVTHRIHQYIQNKYQRRLLSNTIPNLEIMAGAAAYILTTKCTAINPRKYTAFTP